MRAPLHDEYAAQRNDPLAPSLRGYRWLSVCASNTPSPSVRSTSVADGPTSVDQREPAVVNPRQLSTFQSAASGTWVDLLIRLAGATGARRGEILAMRWSDVDWSANKTRIESLYRVKKQIGIKPTKTRQAREISIPPSLVDYLRLHKEWQQNDRDLFGPDTGQTSI